jgi:hypothetical protein
MVFRSLPEFAQGVAPVESDLDLSETTHGLEKRDNRFLWN